MKLVKYICVCVLCFMAAIPFAACSDDPADLFCEVEMLLAAEDGSLMEIVRPDNGQPTTFLRDVNNKRVYPIPTFVNNRASIRVEKGVYVMAFDAEAVMPGGAIRRVRMMGHSVMHDAMIFNRPKVTITLDVYFL